MKTRSVLLGAAAAIALCAAGAVSAAPAVGIGNGGTPPGLGGCPPGQAKKGNCGNLVKAPEIDATAGVQAIAVLSGIMLLIGERARRRTS